MFMSALCLCPCVVSTDVDGSGCCLVIVTGELDELTKLISHVAIQSVAV